MRTAGLVDEAAGRRRSWRRPQTRGACRLLAAAAGILFSFMVLAGALVALKAMGHQVGWGLQFQQPWFLTAMILILTLFACNLWGFFEVLPRAFVR